MTDRATVYAERVTSGDIVAGPHVRDACLRHLRDLDTQRARGLYWDEPMVGWMDAFFRETLRLAGGEHEGRPFELEDWQAFIVGSLFAWKGDDGMRRFRKAYVEAGKGCGKSPLAAGIGLYMLAFDQEDRAEVYAAASKRDQAMILFRDAVAMVDQSPVLSPRVVRSGKSPVWNLAFLERGAFFRPIASDKAQSGTRPHFAAVDEYHEHKDGLVLDMMQAGINKGRAQPLIFIITNSGFDRTSPCWDEHTHAVQVAAGVKEADSFFSYVCAIDDGSREGFPKDDPIMDPPDPELGFPRCWLKTNPSLGVTNKVRDLEEQVQLARGMPAKESIVRRLNFCEWVDAESPWIDGYMWRACEADSIPAPTGMVALGLDLSASLDLTAAARVWRDGDAVYGEVRFWTPADTIPERERRDRIPYDAWIRGGFMHPVPGKVVDYGYVVRDLVDAGWLHGADVLAFDNWNMKYFKPKLDEFGVPWWEYEGPGGLDGVGIKLVAHGQGYGGGGSDTVLWMPQSIRNLTELVLDGAIKIRKNPVLTYCSASAVIEQDAAGNQKWAKRKSTGRIDGIVALSMAVGAAMAFDPVEPSVYEHQGIEWL